MLKSNSEKIISKTILLVEDEVIEAIAQKRALEKQGYNVIYVNSGEKALEVVSKLGSSINLILMDVDLGKDLNGIEISKRILAKNNLPIIFLTGYENEDLSAEIEEIAYYGYVSKSSGDKVLLNTIKMAFTIIEREQRFRAIFDATFQFIGLMTPDGRLLEANQTALDFAGIKAEDIINKPFWEAHWWNGSEARVRQLKEAIARAAQGEFVRYEVELQGSCTTALIDFSLKPIFDKNGKVILLIPEGRDITDYKKVEFDLRESEKQYRSLITEMQQGLAVHEAVFNEAGEVVDYVFLDINESYERLTGLKKDNIIGKPVLTILPDLEPFWIEEYGKVVLSGNPLHFENYVKVLDRYYDVIAYRNREKQFAVIVTDITERKKIEKALQKSERELSTLISNLPGLVYYCLNDEYWTMKFVSEKATDLTGYLPKELIDNRDISYNELIHPEDRARVQQIVQAGVRNKSAYVVEYRIITKDGSIKYVLENGQGLFDESGNLIALQGFVSDISESKKAELELRESERTFATFFYENSNPMAISSIEDGIFINVNNVFLETFGFSREALIGRSSIDLPLWVDPHDRERAVEIVQRTGSVHNFETRLFTKTREIRNVLFSWAPIVANGKKCLMSAVTDITENNKLKEQMQTMQKLESIGVLAGGIAHDFNNLLQGIYGNLQLLKLKLKDTADQQIMQYIDRSLGVFNKASGLAQQLLTYSKGGQPRKEILSLQKLLSNWIEFNLSGCSNIKTEIEIASDLWPVDADPGQINQVISNLVINAKQAMPNGGRLRFQAENIKTKEAHPLLEPGDYILLILQDQGGGIAPENLQKIFDPFFTTKETGTGLGLATAYSIIKKHQGLLVVESTQGEGSTFEIYLPAKPDAQAYVYLPQREETKSYHGRILLMDDEEYILAPTGSFLERCGFEIVTAENGEDAVTIFAEAKEKGENFDLVILDLTIKNGMGGKETMKKLKEIDPGVRAIVASGYSDDPLMTNPQVFGFESSLLKPYHFDELARSLAVFVGKDKEEPK